MNGWFKVFNATFNNISVISWRSALLVEETGVQTCRKSLTNFITYISHTVYVTCLFFLKNKQITKKTLSHTRYERGSNSQWR